MSKPGSYTDYLPPILWSEESDPNLFLAQWLCAFEKILTGIDDDVPFMHAPLEHLIDRIPQLFDPWRTEKRFLPMLASWVGLNLPERWEEDEYRLRKLIAGMVNIYEQRGLKRGLHTYLDIYAATAARPRIAIDDGEAIFRVTLLADGSVQMHTVAYTHQALTPEDQANVALLHPSAIAVASNGSLIVADAGGNDSGGLGVISPTLWFVSNTGELPFEHNNGKAPVLKPIWRGDPLNEPTAVVVDAMGRFNVLDVGKSWAAIHRFTENGFEETIIEKTAFTAVHPVDMTTDPSGRFIVLDRGRHPTGFPPQGASKTQLVIVNMTSTGPPTIEVQPFEGIVEPTAITIDKKGRYIIADAGNQKEALPANLFRVDPANNWEITRLLGDDNNPLVFPTGLAFMGPATLVVCDTGLRWGWKDDRSNRAVAEPAALYRVDLSKTTPVITPLMHMPRLVNPSKIARASADTFIAADRGECYRREESQTGWQEWRAQPHQFGVVVHFSQQRPTDSEERNRMRQEIESVVVQHHPGHTRFQMEI